MALRITKQGLETAGVKDDAVGVAPETSIGAAHDGVEAESPAAKSVAPKADFRCGPEARSKEAAEGEDHSWLVARKPAGLKANARAGDAWPAGGSNDHRHHARDPLAA